MTRQAIATGSSANDGTGDTLRQAADKINENFVEVYQFLSGGDSNNLTSQITIEDSAIAFEGGSANDFETRLAVQEPTADRLVQIPNASGMVVIDTATQTLTNKTLTSPTISSITNSGTLTLPSGADTLVARTSTDTLTNKTLAAPTLNSPIISTSLRDSSGREFIVFAKGTGTPDNEITITNADGTAPSITASGDNTDIGLNINSKGNGSVSINKVAYSTTEITTASAASTVVDNTTFIIGNRGTAIAATLGDGTAVGEYKIFVNRNTGVLTVTPTNFAQGTSFALAQNDGCQCVWDGTKWFLIGNQGEVTVS